MVLPPDMVATITGKEVNDAYIGKKGKRMITLSGVAEGTTILTQAPVHCYYYYYYYYYYYPEYILNLNAKIAYVSQLKPAADGSSLDLAPMETAAGKVGEDEERERERGERNRFIKVTSNS